MQKFIVATKNKGKLLEIKQILKGFKYKVVSMEEEEIYNDVEETGSTFEENAFLKAKEIFNITKNIVMADDSGLEVDYLNGDPGIRTARFAGDGASDKDKIEKLLKLLEGVPFEKRKARFVCAIAVILSETKNFIVKGICEGYIALTPKGNNGFGYDPVFFIPEFNKTAAQLSQELKNSVSHRGNALRLMVKRLQEII